MVVGPKFSGTAPTAGPPGQQLRRALRGSRRKSFTPTWGQNPTDGSAPGASKPPTNGPSPSGLPATSQARANVSSAATRGPRCSVTHLARSRCRKTASLPWSAHFGVQTNPVAAPGQIALQADVCFPWQPKRRVEAAPPSRCVREYDLSMYQAVMTADRLAEPSGCSTLSMVTTVAAGRQRRGDGLSPGLLIHRCRHHRCAPPGCDQRHDLSQERFPRTRLGGINQRKWGQSVDGLTDDRAQQQRQSICLIRSAFT